MSEGNNNPTTYGSSDTQSEVSLKREPQAETTTSPPVAPNGGLEAWLQVLGAFCLFFSSWGLVVAFGAYQDYLELHQLSNYTPSAISWIGTIQGFLLIVVGVFTGPIYDLGYLRELIITGTVLSTLGLMTASVSTEYYQLFLSLGVAVGLGSGCMFVPSVAIVAQWFTTKRSAATGLTATGGSIGGVIFPIVFRKLSASAGFGWATRAIGFIIFAMMLVPLIVLKPRAKPKKARSLFDTKAFFDPAFVLFSLALFIIFVGLYIPFFYVTTYAREKLHKSNELSFYLIAILNAGSIFGRIFPNILADKFGALNLLVSCSLVTGILGLVWLGINNFAGTVVFCVLYGFFSGAVVSLPPTALVFISPDLSVVGTRMGMSFSVAGFGLLIGSPIGGAILSRGGYKALEGFCGATVISGFVLYVLTIAVHRRKTKA